MEWEKETALAEQATVAAGRKLRNVSRDDIIDAGGRDVKHRADLVSEEIIIETLQKGSSYPVLTEERGELGMVDSDSPVWIIDPLDGTVNYSRRICLCCVSVALWHGDNPVLGVINDFNHREIFSGVVGEKAMCNGNPISVSNAGTPQDAILATGFPVNRDFSSKAIMDFLSRVQEFKKIRLLGSAALSLAYTACGRIDAYTEEDIMLWDVAAGIAIVEAAGGFVSFKKSKEKQRLTEVWAGKVFRDKIKGGPV